MDSVIRTRINSETKDKATEILEGCGLTMSTALRLFVEQIVIREGLPFEVSRKPTARLLESMDQAEALLQESKSGFTTINHMLDALENGKS